MLGLIFQDFHTFTANFLQQNNFPLALLVYGFVSQTVYEARSVYQLVYCYRRGKSILPRGYWILAVAGSLMIISYGLIRHDWVLALGQISIFFSIRNLMLSLRRQEQR